MPSSPIRLAPGGLLLGIALLIWAALPATAQTGECAGSPLPPEQAFQQAAAVFTGTALSVQSVRSTADGQTYLRVRFQVSAVEKGDVDWHPEVWSEGPETECGYPFQAGATYHLYLARASDGSLTASRRLPIEARSAPSSVPDATAPGQLAGAQTAWGASPIAVAVIVVTALALSILLWKAQSGGRR